MGKSRSFIGLFMQIYVNYFKENFEKSLKQRAFFKKEIEIKKTFKH